MRINNRLVLVSAVVTGLFVPVAARAQAIPRTTTSSSEAPPPPPASSSSSSGASTREAPPMPPPPQAQPVRSAPPSSGGSSSGTSSRGGSSSGSSTSGSTSSGGGSSAVLRGSGVSSGRPSGGGGGEAPTYVGAGSRTRDGRAISNTAIRRPSPIAGAGGDWLGSAGYPFSPWGRWYPWYTGGWGYGYVSYDPWRVGGTRWVWGRYGTWWYDATPWYDPWYDPYYGMYGGYGYGYAYGSGGGRSRDDEAKPETGGIRIRVSPDKAKVYIDGVLQGVVDDFNGLSSHLDVPVGTHQLELRLEGYVTLKDQITVEGGQTQTFRGTLKKSSK